MLRYLLILVSFFAILNFSNAQKNKKPLVKVPDATAVKDTTGKDKKAKSEAPKPYKEVIDSSAFSQWGLMGIHRVKEKWYFEIGDTMLDKPMLAVTRYTKTAAGGGIYGGEEVKKQMLHWEKGPANKLFMRGTTIVVNSPDSSKPIFQSVQNSNSYPIMASFDIKAIKKDGNKKSYVIDVTDYFNGDEHSFGIGSVRKQLMKLKSIQKESSYINKMSAYPINVEIRMTKTYDIVPITISSAPSTTPGNYIPSGSDAGFVTVELNTSLILLPKNPMKKRYFDNRVGYFANQMSLFGEESQKADKETFILKWRLEPKNAGDAQRQKAGELIEPAKPIVFYIDPATPVKWRKYLIQGIDDWNVAFEEAGWKNAIKGLQWPESDTTMSLEDARFSVIRYFAADIQNAYGPNVHDPRTGEILESHIGWYHNIMRLLRNWYLIQAGATDPRAGKIEYDDELMGQLIRFVSSHEVGHTLGLRHNMGASAATPVEKLRDKEWIAKNGHTSSIMDYARFNYVAQPEDGVTDLFPRIGDYDKWAIKWGYSNLSTTDDKYEKIVLNNMIKEAYKNPRLHFGTESSQHDPRFQREDLGDNAMLASEYGIKNLKLILPKLVEWSAKEASSYAELEEMYDALIGQFRRYVGHVAKNVGGVYDDPMTTDMINQPFRPVPKATQKEAISFLNKNVFTSPLWLADINIINKISPESGVEAISSIQEGALNDVLSTDKLIRLLEFSDRNGYTVDELLTDLEANIIYKDREKDMYHRNLQKVYVSKLIGLLLPGMGSSSSINVGTPFGAKRLNVDLNNSDVPSIARGHLASILKVAKEGAINAKSKIDRYHFEDLRVRIEKALKVD